MPSIQERFCIKNKETVLSVTNNAVTAVKKLDSVKTGLRVYENGAIGIAGAIGAYDEKALEERARHMLKFRIPYAGAPAREICRAEDIRAFELTDEAFLSLSTQLLDELKARYPDFFFSHKIRLKTSEISLRNDCGADLMYKDRYVVIELLIKHRQSKNLFDDIAYSLTRGFLREDMLRAAAICEAYAEKVDIEEGKMPVVVLGEHQGLSKFVTDLNGRQFGSGASLFAQKRGRKLFHEDFSLYVNRDPRTAYESFFDGEGSVVADDRFALIENGVLNAPYSAKRIAAQYDFPVTASASMGYDAVPDVSGETLWIGEGTRTIQELLDGRRGVLVTSASGGDFTAQGEYASPIQTAYLFDGEKLYGRLPQLSMRSNIYDMFGRDFIGVSCDGLSTNTPFRYSVSEMEIGKIGGWL